MQQLNLLDVLPDRPSRCTACGSHDLGWDKEKKVWRCARCGRIPKPKDKYDGNTARKGSV